VETEEVVLRGCVCLGILKKLLTGLAQLSAAIYDISIVVEAAPRLLLSRLIVHQADCEVEVFTVLVSFAQLVRIGSNGPPLLGRVVDRDEAAAALELDHDGVLGPRGAEERHQLYVHVYRDARF